MKLFEVSISEISNWGGVGGYMWGVGGLGKEVELFLLDLMFCWEVILAWWHVHVSDVFLLPFLFRESRYSCTALHLFSMP